MRIALASCARNGAVNSGAPQRDAPRAATSIESSPAHVPCACTDPRHGRLRGSVLVALDSSDRSGRKPAVRPLVPLRRGPTPARQRRARRQPRCAPDGGVGERPAAAAAGRWGVEPTTLSVLGTNTAPCRPPDCATWTRPSGPRSEPPLFATLWASSWSHGTSSPQSRSALQWHARRCGFDASE